MLAQKEILYALLLCNINFLLPKFILQLYYLLCITGFKSFVNIERFHCVLLLECRI